MVSVASLSAGLRPGTNLSAPNHRKTTPSDNRSSSGPCRAIQSVTRRSSLTNVEGTGELASMPRLWAGRTSRARAGSGRDGPETHPLSRIVEDERVSREQARADVRVVGRL